MLTVPTVGVSLKAYLDFQQSLDWLRQTAATLSGSSASLFVMPSFPTLTNAQTLLAGSGIGLGAQDVSSLAAGPATGEVPARMLAEIGCEFAEVGHGERRRRCGESDADVAAKCLRAHEAGLIPVICVGEADRVDRARAVDFTDGQLARRIAQLPRGAEVIVAYEPEWAIGADAAAEPSRIATVTSQVRNTLAAAGITGRVLYGGSANTGVFAAIASSAVSAAQVPDGLFVGRAALDVERLRSIVDEVLLATPAGAR
jgi:triosephosphate isomerase